MKPIDPNLLLGYARMVAMMVQARSALQITLYQQIDRRRAELHDEIAKEAGVPRDDFELVRMLASIVEAHLDGDKFKEQSIL
jgi:hypothetical protein